MTPDTVTFASANRTFSRLSCLYLFALVHAAMLSQIRSLLRPVPAAQYLNFVPLCHLPPGTAKTWHRCPPMILSDAAYDRLHEFLQANLEGWWSLMPQDRNNL